MKIGPKTRAKAVELMGDLLESYQQQIETAYCKTDDPFDVSLKLRFAPAGSHGTKIVAKISFVESEIADEVAEVIDEEQMQLQFAGTD